MTTTHYTLPVRPVSIVASKDLVSRCFEIPVASVVVIGTPTSDNTLFHFRLSLINGSPEDNDRETIRLNMSPSYTDPNNLSRGVLLVEYLASGLPDSPGDSDPFSIAVRSGVIARDIFKCLLDDLKVDLYEFTSQGNGCRHWCATVLEHLGATGFIDPCVGQMFEDYEEQEGFKDRKGGPNFIMPRIRGMFYAPNKTMDRTLDL